MNNICAGGHNVCEVPLAHHQAVSPFGLPGKPTRFLVTTHNIAPHPLIAPATPQPGVKTQLIGRPQRECATNLRRRSMHAQKSRCSLRPKASLQCADQQGCTPIDPHRRRSLQCADLSVWRLLAQEGTIVAAHVLPGTRRRSRPALTVASFLARPCPRGLCQQ